MKDVTGREVSQGDIVVHIGGYRTPRLEEATVLMVEEHRINVQKQSQRPSWLSNERKIAIIGKV